MPRVRKTNSNINIENEPTTTTNTSSHHDSENETSDEASSSSDEDLPELMVTSRSKRANAGNKMAELLVKAETDEFYKSTYGGFQEEEGDINYESPESDNDDEVDSDFDQLENEDEEMSDGQPEDDEKRAKREAKKKKKALWEKNKNWAIRRINEKMVPENKCDPKTQKQRLEEAIRTAKLNVASLKKYEEFEIERKKKHLKIPTKRIVPQPFIKTISTIDGTKLIVPNVKEYEKPSPRLYSTCAVTGKHAHYKDPVTGLNYSDSRAFKIIRTSYISYLKSIDNEEVKKYLFHFETTPHSQSPIKQTIE